MRAAIQEANAQSTDDTISFNIPTTDPGFNSTTGVYTITLNSALFDLSTNINISGPGADKLTVKRSTVNGTPQFRIFNVTTTGIVSFSGLTIANGSVVGPGGGIQNVNAGTVNVTDCTLRGNYASGNSGGGIANGAGTVNVTNCTLDGNHADGFGGGIYNNGGAVTISNSTLSGNSVLSVQSGFGGGIFNHGTATVTNSTFSRNSATGGDSTSGGFALGGAIYHDLGTFNVTNCTLFGNSATGGSGTTGSGGQAFGGGIEGNGTAATVKSTIIANNTASPASSPRPDASGVFTSQGFNLIGNADGSDGFTAATDQKGTTGASLDPKLDPSGLQNNGGPTQTIALLFGSPAIDKGSNTVLTVLSSATDASTTAINVTDASKIPAGVGYTILIDSEQMVVTSKAGNTLTVTRGANSTTAASHSAGASLYPAFDQRGTGFPRTFNDPNVPKAAGGDDTDIGAFEFGGVRIGNSLPAILYLLLD